MRDLQSEYAQSSGIYGFCYYHYWFNGTLLLERPIREIIETGQPDFPFCLCWANEDWTRAWDGRSGEILISHEYSEDDDRRHIQYLCQIFQDQRYIKVAGKPLFLIYRANNIPNPQLTIGIWREEARKFGVGELYLCRVESFPDEHDDPSLLGFDASVEFQPDWAYLSENTDYTIRDGNFVYNYQDVVRKMLKKPKCSYKRFPCVTPSWDNSPRRQSEATIFINSSPETYEMWLTSVMLNFEGYGTDEDFVFINAWNEWGEGNYLEPDTKFGKAYLEATKRAILVNQPDQNILFRTHTQNDLDNSGDMSSEPCCQPQMRHHKLQPNSEFQSLESNVSIAQGLQNDYSRNLHLRRIKELEGTLERIYSSRGWRLLRRYYQFRDGVKRRLRKFRF